MSEGGCIRRGKLYLHQHFTSLGPQSPQNRLLFILKCVLFNHTTKIFYYEEDHMHKVSKNSSNTFLCCETDHAAPIIIGAA